MTPVSPVATMINRCSRLLLIACVTGVTLCSGVALASNSDRLRDSHLSAQKRIAQDLIAQDLIAQDLIAQDLIAQDLIAQDSEAAPESESSAAEQEPAETKDKSAQPAKPAKSAKPSESATETAKAETAKSDWIWWAATGFVLVAVGGGTVYGLTRLNPMAAPEPQKKPAKNSRTARSLPPAKPANTMQKIEARQAELRRTEVAHQPEVTLMPPSRGELLEQETEENPTIFISPADIAEHKAIHAAKKSGVASTSRLSKIDIIEDLINDLYSHDGAKRRKAIWDLGQMGDSRAVQPLADLMIDSDSAQRSLILGAMSEVAMRTLKPLHQALLISIQDSNADVRKNAVRDVTRVYEMVTQISQLLHHAANDSDPEVQETAKWALGQLNQMRSLPQMEDLPILPTTDSAPKKGAKNGNAYVNGSPNGNGSRR